MAGLRLGLGPYRTRRLDDSWNRGSARVVVRDMHSNVNRAIQEIDAAVFNGDAFEDEDARAELLEYLERWRRALGELDDYAFLDEEE